MKRFFDWFDARTGFREARDEALLERIPGGSRFSYVWGSTLVYTFVLQVLTGIFLWTAYSPSAQSAWESVYYIQYVMQAGGLVRSIHHYAAQAMIVLMALHFLQVLIHKAYLAPREINFWLGLVLMQIVFGLGLTGYLLPWDQKGYYATKVATSIMASTPMIGPELQTLVQGGANYGHHTLTRFFALHVGVLPATLATFLVLHIAVFRRHGITVPDPHRRPESLFWPDQILKDAIACSLVLAGLLTLAWFRPAELSPPADPSEAYSAARPEWYFLFLFRFLKIEAVDSLGVAFGAIYVPGAIMGFLVLMPLIGMIKKKSPLALGLAGVLGLLTLACGYFGYTHFQGHEGLMIGSTEIPAWACAQLSMTLPLAVMTAAMVFGGHVFNLSVIASLMVGVVGLTGIAINEDANSEAFIAAEEDAERKAIRVRELAAGPEGIPPAGATWLLRNDPFTRGPLVFKAKCSSCHHYNGHDGTGSELTQVVDGKSVPIEPYAPDLGNFGSRDWHRQVLLNYHEVFEPIENNAWFQEQNTDGEYKVQAFLRGHMAKFSEENREELEKESNQPAFAALVELLAAQGDVAEDIDAELAKRGVDVFNEGTLNEDELVYLSNSCATCHAMQIPDETGQFLEMTPPSAEGDERGPELTAYASQGWLKDFILHPEHERFYGEKNRMTVFGENDRITEQELDMVVRWMTGDYIPSKLPKPNAEGGEAEANPEDEADGE